MKISDLTLIVSMICLSACASAPSFNTASGKPEAHIGGKNKKQVVDSIMNLLYPNENASLPFIPPHFALTFLQAHLLYTNRNSL